MKKLNTLVDHFRLHYRNFELFRYQKSNTITFGASQLLHCVRTNNDADAQFIIPSHIVQVLLLGFFFALSTFSVPF